MSIQWGVRRLMAATVLGVVACSSAWGASATERLRHFIDGTKTFKASFTQTVQTKSTARKAQVTTGNVWIARPGKFRWQIEKPYPQLMVGDGQKIWLYDPDLKQATVRKMADSLAGTPAALLAGDNAFEKSFTFKDAPGTDGLDWVEATPKAKDSTFARVRLGFKGEVLSDMEMQDNFGQTTLIKFGAVEKNPSIAPTQFKFAPPAGVDVVGE